MHVRIVNTNQIAEFIDFDPAGCFPPDLIWHEVPENLRPWIDHSWRYTDGVFTPPDLAHLLAVMRARLAGRREAAIGMAGRDVRALAAALAAPTSTFPIHWRMSAGEYRSLPRPAARRLLTGLRAHEQACFDRERAIDGALVTAAGAADANALALIAAFDAAIDTGWPGDDETPSESD